MAPYGGRPVPRCADTSPTGQVVEEWFEEYNVVPADDGESSKRCSQHILHILQCAMCGEKCGATPGMRGAFCTLDSSPRA
jgi:hypothetical protein